MDFDALPPSRDEPQSLRYVCDSCCTPLVLPASKAGTSGPCPICRKWIEASKFVFPENPSRGAIPQVPSASGPVARKRKQPVTSGKGRLQADGFLDHDYSERKELFGTLRVLAVFLVVAAVILFVILYLRDWMMK